jgi:hypothetical protein
MPENVGDLLQRRAVFQRPGHQNVPERMRPELDADFSRSQVTRS